MAGPDRSGPPPRPPPISASMARRQTCTIMGTPQMSARGLPGKRVDAMRAGITTSGCPAMSFPPSVFGSGIIASSVARRLPRRSSKVRRIAAIAKPRPCARRSARLTDRSTQHNFLDSRGFGALIRLAAKRRKRLISAPILRGPCRKGEMLLSRTIRFVRR